MCVYVVSAVPHRRDVVCTYSPVSWIQPGLDQMCAQVCLVDFGVVSCCRSISGTPFLWILGHQSLVSRLSGNVNCLCYCVEKAVMSRDKDTVYRIIGRVEI